MLQIYNIYTQSTHIIIISWKKLLIILRIKIKKGLYTYIYIYNININTFLEIKIINF